MSLYLGIDVGTSGVRTEVIDSAGNRVASASVPMVAPLRVEGRPCQDAQLWWEAVSSCLAKQASSLRSAGNRISEIEALSVDGTSGTLVLTDASLRPLTLGYMYNSADLITADEADAIASVASASSMALGTGSGLARLLFLQREADRQPVHALHQADWISARLTGHGGLSDETNVLKMGYDVKARQWPDWFGQCGVDTSLLPTVVAVGDAYGEVCSESCTEFGFRSGTKVIAGTTDSNAAFLASGATEVGDGVTSLGTTLAIKLLSDKPISDPTRGIYSHRIKDMWLPGGASNSGGGVLLDHFTTEQMAELQKTIDPDVPTGLAYYPLSVPGERFPIADPKLQPRMTPRPASDAKFFQGLLEGISEIEAVGYAALQELGAPRVTKVFTAGGGAKNHAWTKIRSSKLGVPILSAQSSSAAHGAARIAAGRI